jgi:DNA-binding Lrp family transcriptional regulator
MSEGWKIFLIALLTLTGAGFIYGLWITADEWLKHLMEDAATKRIERMVEDGALKDESILISTFNRIYGADDKFITKEAAGKMIDGAINSALITLKLEYNLKRPEMVKNNESYSVCGYKLEDLHRVLTVPEMHEFFHVVIDETGHHADALAKWLETIEGRIRGKK